MLSVSSHEPGLTEYFMSSLHVVPISFCTGGIFVLTYFYRTFLGGNTGWLNISTCSRRGTGGR